MNKIVSKLIDLERKSQDQKHPHKEPIDDFKWLAVLTEEFLELAQAINDKAGTDRIGEELIQVTAVGVRWLETMVKENIRSANHSDQG